MPTCNKYSCFNRVCQFTEERGAVMDSGPAIPCRGPQTRPVRNVQTFCPFRLICENAEYVILVSKFEAQFGANWMEENSLFTPKEELRYY